MPQKPPSHRPARPNVRQHLAPLSAHKRGYTRAWRKLRLAFLADHPTCATPGCHMPATEVDHKIPHRGDRRLLCDPANLQALCGLCHKRKTALYDNPHPFGRMAPRRQP